MTRTLRRPGQGERHLGDRAAWLRAAVLGANDGLVSTASLTVAVAAAGSDRGAILVAAIAALTAGALSMAAGEYVSVSSQRDTEEADLARERHELATTPELEREELVGLYQARGLSRAVAEQVADEMATGDLLAVHARDELGIDPTSLAKPVQAAVVSALSFVAGAVVPIIVVLAVPEPARLVGIAVTTLAGLGSLGALGARIGGAPVLRAAVRVLVGGSLALAISLGIGQLTGAVV